jgi:uncharacterized protein
MWCRFLFVLRLLPQGALDGRGMRATWLLLIAPWGAACERTPPEDFASHPSALVMTPSARALSAPVAAETSVLANRCILPTPAQRPPPVPSGPPLGCPPDPEGLKDLASPRTMVRVAFPEAAGVAVQAEVVRSQHDTARGLMYRTNLAEDRGMLFDLGVREDHKFWMHNTCIPLDLLYVDEDGLVVGIVENAPTLNDDARGVGCPSLYVLEVNAGWGRRHGVKAGQHMTVPPEVTQK